MPRLQHGYLNGTLTYLHNNGAPALDHHYAYDKAAHAIILGMNEMLIQIQGTGTDQYDLMLADSWETNSDQPVITFNLFLSS